MISFLFCLCLLQHSFAVARLAAGCVRGSGVWGGQQWDGRYQVGAYATYEHARSQNCYSHVQAERGREGV